MQYFKVFGAKRSGATYLKALLEDNVSGIKILTDELGSCYEPPMDITMLKEWVARNKRGVGRKSTSLLVKASRNQLEINPIVIIKDPYTWFKSIRRWFGKKKLDMVGEYAKYNELYKGCKDLIENTNSYGKIYNRCVFITYEDLLTDTEYMINGICKFYGISSDKIKNPLKITDKIKNSAKFTKKGREIYLSNGPYKIDMSVINYVTSLVDWEVIGSYYGYYPMDPRDFHELSRPTYAQLTHKMRQNEIIPILSKYGADRRIGVRNRPLF